MATSSYGWCGKILKIDLTKPVNRRCFCRKDFVTGTGGFFGPFLKKAGYDGLIISGCSQKPVYIWIHDDAESVL